MGEPRSVTTYLSPTDPPPVPDGVRVTRARPRAFVEWQALRRWGKLPPWEHSVAGYLMRQAREDAGLTQRELAARLNVSQQAVAQAERWQSNPSIDLLSRWAAATQTTLVVDLAPHARGVERCPRGRARYPRPSPSL